MKFPFALEVEDFKFSASEHIAKRDDLTDTEKATVSMVDVIEQRSNKCVNVAMTHRWWLIVLSGTYLVTNGKDALAVIIKWAGIST